MSSINNLSDVEAKWFAVYTKYKTEKFVWEKLQAKNIQAYVPLVTETKKYTRKIKTYSKPLINCYVFVKIERKDYIRVLETDYVMSFLKIRNDLIAIPENEILLLKRIVGEVNDIEVNQEYIEGEEVEVISGNLTGLKGKLIYKESKNNFLIELETIGLQMRMQINPAFLKPTRKRVKASFS